MSDDVYLRCQHCGWVHVAVAPGEPGGTSCFRCHGRTFAGDSAANIPRGVTLQALTWPLPDEEPDVTNDFGRFTPEHEPDGEEMLYAVLLKTVEQACGTTDPDVFDSWAISAYELAIETLDQAGFVEIDGKGRISAKLTQRGRTFAAWMDAWRDAQDVWVLSATTPIPPGGPVNIMKHRHLVPGVGFTSAAIDDILDRGHARDWVPLVQVIQADPHGEIAETTLRLCDTGVNHYASPIFRRVIARARKVHSKEEKREV